MIQRLSATAIVRGDAPRSAIAHEILFLAAAVDVANLDGVRRLSKPELTVKFSHPEQVDLFSVCLWLRTLADAHGFILALPEEPALMSGENILELRMEVTVDV